MRLYKKNAVLFLVVIILAGVTWIALITGPDFSQEEQLEKKLAELRDRLQYANAKNQERERDISTLQQQFKILHRKLNIIMQNSTHYDPKATILPQELRHILNNLSFTSNDVQPPSIFYLLPHLAGHAEGLQTSFKLSQGRSGVSIVMGVPTIKRDKVSYLHETLQSLLDGLDHREKDDALIIVFVAEPNELDYVNKVAEEIEKRYPSAVHSGLIEVISPSAAFYPDFETIRLTFGDTKERVKWRTKQNLDYAFLMMYAKSRGTYYVQLEDDVITKPGFVAVMKNFALNQKTDEWLMLDFSLLGFIGKLFKSNDLPIVIEFFLMFYKDKPIDWLLDHLLYVKTCSPEKDATHCERMKNDIRIRYKPSLFQHIGVKSSLRGKVQKLKDRSFGKAVLHRAHNNPPAEVSTTLKIYQQYSIDRAYRGETFFWSLLPEPGDKVKFKFTPPIEIESYNFKSGNSEHPGDQFYNTTVEILPLAHIEKHPGLLTNSDNQEDYPMTSDGYLIVGNFTYGSAFGTLAPNTGLISELRLHALSSSPNWVILSEIHIVPKNSPSKTKTAR